MSFTHTEEPQFNQKTKRKRHGKKMQRIIQKHGQRSVLHRKDSAGLTKKERLSKSYIAHRLHSEADLRLQTFRSNIMERINKVLFSEVRDMLREGGDGDGKTTIVKKDIMRTIDGMAGDWNNFILYSMDDMGDSVGRRKVYD